MPSRFMLTALRPHSLPKGQYEIFMSVLSTASKEACAGDYFLAPMRFAKVGLVPCHPT